MEVYGELAEEEILKIWLFCNSSLLWLLRELTGRTNLGGGMLKAEATDLKGIPLCYDFDVEKILPLYTALRGRKLNTNLLATLIDPDHLALDRHVLSSLGLEDSLSYIVTSLTNRASLRTNKSKTNKA